MVDDLRFDGHLTFLFIADTKKKTEVYLHPGLDRKMLKVGAFSGLRINFCFFSVPLRLFVSG